MTVMSSEGPALPDAGPSVALSRHAMMTIQLCKFSHCRLWPAWGSNAVGWQIHWLWLYVEWRSNQKV